MIATYRGEGCTVATVTKELKRLSLCPKCPFPFLSEEIKLGQEYVTLDGISSQTYKVRCGGCGKIYDPGPTILAFGILHPNDAPRPLPLVLFQEIGTSAEPTQVPQVNRQI